MIDVVIPCKRFASGKSRLAPLVPPACREALCRCLLERTLATARDITDAIAVVSADADVLALAEARGARAVIDPDAGLNAALRHANDCKSPLRPLLVLPIDLPYATTDSLIRLCRSPTDVTIASDGMRSGTNVLKLAATARRDFPFAYGPHSFERHLAHAHQRGFSVTVTEDPRLSFDLDEPEDYVTWIKDKEREAQ